jgi:ubiquinone/menaquinone biosynthesis C-methylase UbiE
MLSVAGDKLNRFKNIHLACCDAEEIPVRHAPHFDLIVSSSSLQWFSSLDTSVSRLIAENLETGGWFHAALFGRNTLWELSRVISMSRPGAELPAASFPESEQDMPLTRAMLTDFTFKKSTIERQYKGLFDLIKALKNTGVSPRGDSRPIFASRMALESAHEIYLREFGTITASYEIIFVSGRKWGKMHLP